MTEKTSQPDLVKIRRENEKLFSKAAKITFAGLATVVAFDPVLGLPIGLYGIGKSIRPIVSQHAIEKMLLSNPELAKEVAVKAATTEFAAYFETLAKRAEGKAIKRAEELRADAERLKYREWLKPRSEMVRKVMERRADLARAGREWKKRNKKIRKRIDRERKVMNAKRKAKQALRAMAAGARKVLGRRKKPT